MELVTQQVYRLPVGAYSAVAPRSYFPEGSGVTFELGTQKKIAIRIYNAEVIPCPGGKIGARRAGPADAIWDSWRKACVGFLCSDGLEQKQPLSGHGRRDHLFAGVLREKQLPGTAPLAVITPRVGRRFYVLSLLLFWVGLFHDPNLRCLEAVLRISGRKAS